jgi:hypothetical protein
LNLALFVVVVVDAVEDSDDAEDVTAVDNDNAEDGIVGDSIDDFSESK